MAAAVTTPLMARSAPPSVFMTWVWLSTIVILIGAKIKTEQPKPRAPRRPQKADRQSRCTVADLWEKPGWVERARRAFFRPRNHGTFGLESPFPSHMVIRWLFAPPPPRGRAGQGAVSASRPTLVCNSTSRPRRCRTGKGLVALPKVEADKTAATAKGMHVLAASDVK